MGATPRKRFGQHWLRSEKALHKIVAAAELDASDRVLEIGPGQGALTQLLLPQAGRVIAIEIDRDLCKKLIKQFHQAENFLLLQGDILELDWQAQLANFPDFQQPSKVVANIPYYITGPILELLLGTIAAPNPQPFETIVLLVQKEVAVRLCANPGNRNFGALSVRVQYLAECEFICDVPAKAFYPPPKVDSAVIRLRPRSQHLPVRSPQELEKLIKLGFSAKRKMLRNNLKSIIERDQLTEFLAELDVQVTARPEDLTVAQWIDLSDRLLDHET